MILHIYYSKKFENLSKYKDFFIKEYFFKDRDILSARLFDIYFFDIDNYQQNKKAIDIILIDDDFIGDIYDNTSLQQTILDKWKKNKRVIFVGLSEYCTQLTLWSKAVNFIRAFDKKDLFDFLYTEITHDILRFILEKEKLNIFISHAKKDGREIAKLLKEFIDNDVKLDNFFDETDIQSSDSWQKSLEENVENSLFLFVYSDYYCHTVWTQQELIWAKQKKVPMLGIDVLAKADTRVFPYLGNVKMLKLLSSVENVEYLYNGNFSLQSHHNMRLIINALLKEALGHYLFIQNHKTYEEDYLVLPKAPELFDMCNNSKAILYPDPPLMKEEQKILEQCFKQKIYTPLLLSETKKTNKKIAISISEPQDLEAQGFRIEHINMLMVELARYLFIKNNTLLYGGDLGYKNKFNFTQVLVDMLKSYNNYYDDIQRIRNYAVKPFSNFVDKKIKNQYIDVIDFKSIGTECELFEINLITKNLTKMRETLTEDMDIKIAVGGKVTGFSGFYIGVLEEIYLAIKSNKPTYLIGGFGGVTKRIIDLINGKEDEKLKFEYQKIHTEKLRNFLASNSHYEDEIKLNYNEMYSFFKEVNTKQFENLKICESNSIDEIVAFILEDI
jgi:hypothetical protein